MKLPSDIKSKHRIRDSRICTLYARDGVSPKKIASQFKMSVSQVHRIVYKHRDAIKFERIHEKTKRIAHLKRLLNVHPNSLGKKSTMDIIKELRAELEGDKSDINVGVSVTVMPVIELTDGKPLEFNIGGNRKTTINP